MKKLFNPLVSFLSNAPSIVWIFLLPLGLIAFIGSIIGLFYLLSSVEGFASLIMIVVAWFSIPSKSSNIFESISNDPALAKNNKAFASFAKAGLIVFYALMGMAIDQPGNWVFNQPIQYLFCPTETTLSRGIDIFHPLPERTDIVQNFTCIDGTGKKVKQISMSEIIGIRFFEYVIVAYLLIAIKKIL